ncbi:ABC transporter substrate-binding protein [Paeniglutamicibacter cryotolerans]|uniref:Peptide/nickel transport system substrate-binding protein n=1 Tax=Paeniglutamicibacter cryotolerans TaxID=670079 RepID=A0A839QKH4_9MICC|nr:ABC transporter substrate-binding protein [Paeniglutamicibacter cryotolerans]MBB2995065.1 peptide/nickel transport system substrate-binding protein [Paeniglutamicibacter cryotolerans]
MNERVTSARPLRKRFLAAGASMAVGALMLSGCAQSQREEKPSAGTSQDVGAGAEAVDPTFIFAASSDPKSLDPAFASDGESFRVSRQIFEGLVGTVPGTADPAPMLAESWTNSDDGLSYDFKLKSGVTFQDGTPFNAEAVCANFDRWYNFTGIQQADSVAYYYSSLFKGFKDKPEGAVYKSCEAVSDTEAKIDLAEPFAGFVAALSLPAFAMQSPTAMKEFKADEISGSAESPVLSEYAKGHPVGTGPFKFDKWSPGDNVELSAYDNYWGDQGQVQKIVFRMIDDPVARRQSLEAGDIDGYDLVAPADTKALKDAGYNVLSREPFTILYLGLNQKVKELQDVKVRQAISYAIDKDALIKQTLPEGTKKAIEFIPDVVNGYNSDVEAYDFNPEKAKELLKEAGYPDGFTIKFNYPTGVSRPYMPTPEQVFTNISAQLKDVGIKVDPQPNKWAPDYLDRVQATADHGIHLLGWTGDYNDTDNFVGVFFGQEKPEFGFENKALFDKLTKARGIAVLAEQTPLYEEINADVAKFVPAVPLAHPAPSLAFDSRVESYPTSPVNDEVFNEIKLTK